MPYYHVRIKYTEVGTSTHLRFFVENLSERVVRRKITEPFNDGVSFRINDEFFEGGYVDDVAIFKTDMEFKYLIYEIRKKYDYNADFNDIWTYIMEGKIGENVSDAFLSSRLKRDRKTSITKKHNKTIFIVHGKDFAAVKELKSILKDEGLNPIVLHEKASGSLTLVEKLEKYSRDLGFAFVILTPDDIGALAEDILGTTSNKVSESTRPLTVIIDQIYKINSETTRFKLLELFSQFFTNRARQNVVFEFGYFIGLLGRERVCCLYKGNVELPSDMHGVCYVPFKNSINEVKDMILKELREAGYKIRV